MKILGWVLYILPFALFSLSAALIATSGWSILSAFSRMFILIYASCLVMCCLYALSMRWATRHPMLRILRSLRDALGLAFFSNSLVAMPLAMERLEKELKLPGPIVSLVMPLGTVMNRHIYPLIFALMGVMTAQFYGHSLTLVDVATIAATSAAVGMAAVGNLAVVAPFVQDVLEPLGLPAGFAVILLVQSVALINPVVKLTQLFGTCATTSVICKPTQREIRK
jgi:proton glutamate symport protein